MKISGSAGTESWVCLTSPHLFFFAEISLIMESVLQIDMCVKKTCQFLLLRPPASVQNWVTPLAGILLLIKHDQQSFPCKQHGLVCIHNFKRSTVCCCTAKTKVCLIYYVYKATIFFQHRSGNQTAAHHVEHVWLPRQSHVLPCGVSVRSLPYHTVQHTHENHSTSQFLSHKQSLLYHL